MDAAGCVLSDGLAYDGPEQFNAIEQLYVRVRGIDRRINSPALFELDTRTGIEPVYLKRATIHRQIVNRASVIKQNVALYIKSQRGVGICTGVYYLKFVVVAESYVTNNIK